MKPATETIIALVVVAALLMSGYFTGRKVANDTWQAKWSLRDAADAKAATKASEAARHNEQQAAENAAAIDKAYQEGFTHAKNTADRIIDNLRRGNIRVRASLTCTLRSIDMPGTNSATRITNAASECGLSTADAEFLIRFAERADKVAEQLKATQAFIKAEYERSKKRANIDVKSKVD